MLSSLEPRYQRILELNAKGHTTKEIAQLCGLTRSTVNTYFKDLKREFADELGAKGDLPTRAALAVIYHRLNQTQPTIPENLEAFSFRDVSYERQLTLFRLLGEAAILSLWSGTPSVTVHIASSASKELEPIIQELPSNSEYRNEFLDVLIQLVVQQGWAHSQLSSFHTNWSLNTGFDQNLRRMADQYSRREPAVLAEFFLADGYSLAFDQRNVVKTLQNALQAAEEINHRWLQNTRFLGLVKLAGTWANLAEEQKVAGNEAFSELREFRRLAHQIEDALSRETQVDASDVAYAYDRLATATAAFHQPIARDYLDKARYYTALTLASDAPVPIREVQLVDVEFAVRKGLDPGSSFADMETVAARAIDKALSIGCTRLAIHIQGWFT